jgi:hypothetical protein
MKQVIKRVSGSFLAVMPNIGIEPTLYGLTDSHVITIKLNELRNKPGL